MSSPKPQAGKTELEIQIADILWVFGRRGFTDTESVDDSVRETTQAVNAYYLGLAPKHQREITPITEDHNEWAVGYNQGVADYQYNMKKGSHD